MSPKNSLESQDNSRVLNFMAQVRELCRVMGIKQKDLASALGLKPSQMNLYFQGKVEMRTERLLAVLAILGIDVEAMLTEKLSSSGAKFKEDSVTPNRVLSRLGGLDESKRKSLMRIIDVLGA